MPAIFGALASTFLGQNNPVSQLVNAPQQLLQSVATPLLGAVTGQSGGASGGINY